MLLYNALSFFFKFSPLDFITGSEWNPTSAEPVYGLLPLVASTSLVSLGAMVIAIPLGIGTAAFISEYAGPRLCFMGKYSVVDSDIYSELYDLPENLPENEKTGQLKPIASLCERS